MTNTKDSNVRGLSASTKRDKEDEPKKGTRDAPQTKVIIRRLPPSLTAEAFLELVAPLPEHDYFNFVPVNKSADKSFAFTRAYLRFVDFADVFIFKEKFDGYVFLDPKGNEYPAVVEFAPYQRVPKKVRKADTKVNTIDQDPEYKKFLESLERNEHAQAPTLQELLQQVEAAKGAAESCGQETPLLVYIKKKREEKRKLIEKQREERQRELERKKVREEEERRRRLLLEKEQRALKDRRRLTGDKDKVKRDKDDERDDRKASGNSEKAGDAKMPRTAESGRGSRDAAADGHRQSHGPAAAHTPASGEARSSGNVAAASTRPASGTQGGGGQSSKTVTAPRSSAAAEKMRTASSASSKSRLPASSTAVPRDSVVARGANCGDGGGGGGPAHSAAASVDVPRVRPTVGGSSSTSAHDRDKSGAKLSGAKDRPARSAGQEGSKSYSAKSSTSSRWEENFDRPPSRKSAVSSVGGSTRKEVQQDVQLHVQAQQPRAGSEGAVETRAASERQHSAAERQHSMPESRKESEQSSRGSCEEAAAVVTTSQDAARRGGRLQPKHDGGRSESSSQEPSSQSFLGNRRGGTGSAADAGMSRTKGEDENEAVMHSDDKEKSAARREQQKPRYKERPERAIYDPAARAAERRQKQAGRKGDGIEPKDAV